MPSFVRSKVALLEMNASKGSETGVIIWLGPEVDDSALARKTMEYTGTRIRLDLKTRTWRPAEGVDPRFYCATQHGQGPPLSSHQEVEVVEKLVARCWLRLVCQLDDG